MAKKKQRKKKIRVASSSAISDRAKNAMSGKSAPNEVTSPVIMDDPGRSPQGLNTGAIGEFVASANTASMGGTISAKEAAGSVSSANNASGSISSANKASGSIKGARKVNIGGTKRDPAMDEGGSQRQRGPQASPGQVTPFFEGANAYDPEIGYFKVQPGMSPEQTLELLRSERSGRSRTIRGR